ncbi:hypothetical protein MRS44_011661 [Fusarium solani]|uniref:uncharacterized protein n=1 Tax=Fusarium solani TaxID=169388 RepID=UPI0032C46F7D|nr:hypothetical protein MRS44_011661 [Fusarium solani]
MLGRGGYGEVWLQKCTTGPRVGDLRAVKEIPKDVTKASEDGHAKIRHQELSALIKFSHQQYRDYFVSSFGWFQTPKALFITMQYFPQGDLQSHIAQALPNEEACTITRQILQGLSFMHQNKFAHRDLKPAEKGPNWWIKLSDFGCSKEATTLRTTVGTPPYWAPELCHIFTRADEDAYDFVEHRTYSFQVDIWSAGVIAFRLATGVLPFGRNLHSELTQATEGDLRGSISSQATVPRREARPMITTSAETTMTLTVETGQDFLEMDKRLLLGTIASLAFSPDGKWFASRRLPGDPEEGISGICIWKVDEQGVSQKSHSLTWECRRQMPVKVLFSSDSLGLVVFLAREPSRSSHEQLIAVSCILGARGYFEPVIGYYISNNKCVKRNAILKNGRRIILVWYDPKSKQRRMTIWDVNPEGDFEIFQEHEEPNDAFVWSEDGEQYLGVRADKTNGHHFSKSQTPGGMLLRQPLPTKYWLTSKAAFSPDGRWCAVDTLHSYQGFSTARTSSKS